MLVNANVGEYKWFVDTWEIIEMTRIFFDYLFFLQIPTHERTKLSDISCMKYLYPM